MQAHTPHNHSPPLQQEAGVPPDIDQLASLHGRAVFHAAYRVLGDAAQAEDVQQGVFMRLLEKPPRQAVERWAAFLCAMATRSAIDELRRRQRWQRLSERLGLGGSPEQAMPPEVFDQDRRARVLRRALARLPRRQAQCFALRFFDGLSIEDIAGSLSVSANVVSVSLNRATRSLRQHVEALEPSPAEPAAASRDQEDPS